MDTVALTTMVATDETPLITISGADDLQTERETSDYMVYLNEMEGPPVAVRCGDECPTLVRFFRNVLLGCIGVLCLLLLVLPVLLLLVCVSYACCCCFGNGRYNERTPDRSSLRCCCCCGRAPRYFFSSWRLRLTLVPLRRRGCFWAAANFLVGFYQSLEMIAHSSQGIANLVYFSNDLSNKYGDYFPLLYGVGCADAARVADIMRNDGALLKGHTIFSVASPDIVRLGYGTHEPIYLESPLDTRTRTPAPAPAPAHKMTHAVARRLHHALQAYFRARVRKNRRGFVLDLQRVVRATSAISDAKLKISVVKALYYCLLGCELEADEVATLVRFNSLGIASVLMPSSMHFCLAGYYLERNVVEKAILTVKGIYVRTARAQPMHPVFMEIIKVCNQEGIPVWQAINMLCIQPLIGALPAMMHCVTGALTKLRENPETLGATFDANPYHFMLESLRLSGVPFANMTITLQTDEELEIGGRVRTVPKGTLLQLMHGCRMREAAIFGADCNRFNPERKNLLQSTSFNAAEKGFGGYCTGQRTPTAQYLRAHPASFRRYCTGHDVALFSCKLVLEQHRPKASYLAVGVGVASGESVTSMFSKFYKANTATKHWQKEVRKVCDPFTTVTTALFKSAAKEHNMNPPSVADISAPNVFQPETSLMGVLGKYCSVVDEDSPRRNVIKEALLAVIANKKLVEFDESKWPDEDWQSIDFAVFYREKHFKQTPPPNVVYDELLSNRAMTQFAFYGVGCQHMRKLAAADAKMPGTNIDAPTDAVYIHDFSLLSFFAVRPMYERYGAVAYFNEGFEIIGIYWCHGERYVQAVEDGSYAGGAVAEEEEKEEEDEEEEDDVETEYTREKRWAHAKWCYKISAFSFVTVVDHLVWTHFIESNHLVTSAQQCLPSAHPLRLFLRPFNFNTVEVNYTATLSLSNRNGFVHRLWAFQYPELVKIFNIALRSYAFKTLPEFVHPSMRDVDDRHFPLHADCTAFWRIMRKYVAGFIHAHYRTDAALLADAHVAELCRSLYTQLLPPFRLRTRDALIDVLTQLICNVTGVHEQVGQVSDYVSAPNWMGTKIKPGKEVCQKQNYVQLLTLTLMTGLRQPGLLDDWSHLIPRDEHYDAVKRGYREWKQELQELVELIDARNQNRVYAFQAFNPRYLECSVSV